MGEHSGTDEIKNAIEAKFHTFQSTLPRGERLELTSISFH